MAGPVRQRVRSDFHDPGLGKLRVGDGVQESIWIQDDHAANLTYRRTNIGSLFRCGYSYVEGKGMLCQVHN